MREIWEIRLACIYEIRCACSLLVFGKSCSKKISMKRDTPRDIFIRKFPCHCINHEFFDDNNYPLDVPSVGGCSVSPFFLRRFVPPRLPGSGSAETHFPSEERKNDATSIDQNRMTPREKSSLEIEHARGKCFFFLSLSPPPMRHRLAAFRCAAFLLSFALNGFSWDSFLSLSSLVGYAPPSNETREIVSLIRGFDIWGEYKIFHRKSYLHGFNIKIIFLPILFSLWVSVYHDTCNRPRSNSYWNFHLFIKTTSFSSFKNKSSIHFSKYHFFDCISFPLLLRLVSS